MMLDRSLTMFLLPTVLLAGLVTSAGVPTKCYVLDGTSPSNAGYRCNNATTGQSSCCAAGGICYSNGVCQQSNGNVQDYLRVGCTDPTFKDPACLDQCRTFANGSTAGIRFCGGSITDTNQYCCDDGSEGVGSFHCCDSPSDIFAINPIATVLAQIPLTYTSTTSTSSTATSKTSISSSTPTTSATHTPTSSSSNKGSNKGAAIGAGVGVPVGVLILAGIAFLFWRHRKKAKKQQAVELENNQNGHARYTDGNTPIMEAEGSLPGVAGGKKGYFGGREYSAAPQELPLTQPHVVHEIGDTER